MAQSAKSSSGTGRKAAAKKTAARSAPTAASREAETAEPVPGQEAPAAPAAAPAPSPSVLEKVRRNRMGALASALLVALAVALLLAVLVPTEPNLLALVILGSLEAAAVGFTVRYLSHDRGLAPQATALLATVIGVHVLTVTGAVGGDLPLVGQFVDVGVAYSDALLLALATPALSTGSVLAGLAAAIIAGWGPRDRAER